MTDLSKAFDCLSHEFLLTKRLAYGFSIAELRLNHTYLTNRKQIIKVNLSYSWEENLFGVPQVPILWPLLFNIFFCDLFFIMNEVDFSSFTDDNTPHRMVNTISEIIQSLEHDSMMLFKRLKCSKCHLLMNKKDKVIVRTGDT